MAELSSTLAPRGAELAHASTSTKTAYSLLKNEYHPLNNPNGIINLAVAENYAMLDEIAHFFSKAKPAILSEDYSYGMGPWGSQRLRSHITSFVNKHAHPLEPFTPSNVFAANGCTSIMELLGFTLFEEGDGVLLTKPSYSGFNSNFTLKAKVKPVYVSFGDVDPFSPEAIVKYEEAFERASQEGIKIRSIMLCNPHNPLGRCYSQDAIIGLMKFCQSRKLHFISDEIYLLSHYQGGSDQVPFRSVFSFDSSQYIQPEYLHMMYGLSKDMAASGLRLGFLFSKNLDLLSAMAALATFHWVNPITDRMACLMFEDKVWLEDFLERSHERLQNANDLARAILDSSGIKYEKRASAGFYLWLDCREFLPKGEDGWAAEMTLFKRIAEHGTGVTPGQASQYAEQPGYFRLVFFHSDKVLKLALERLVLALKG